MGINTLPAAGGGGIKLVQRGQATSSGNITITAVDTSKTFVRSFSEGSTGTVATNSVASGPTNNTGYGAAGSSDGGWGTDLGSVSRAWTRAMTGGSTDVTAKQMGVHLLNSTTLVATGACRWEVVEFN